MYENPRNIFQQKIKNVVNKESRNSDLFEDIFKLNQLFVLEKIVAGVPKEDPESWKILMELFSTFGSIQFAKIIAICKGKVISFPTEEEFEDSIVTTLCYYYKEMENLSWDEIKGKLSMPKLNTIKYGIRVRQFRDFVNSQILQPLKKKR
jgi:hypothetical protein